MSATFESTLPRRKPVTADRAHPDVTFERITVRQSDTDVVKHDTNTFASTDVVVAGKATPRQCRGQVEGGVAQALGATLFENVRVDARGEVETAAFRRYRLPQYADIPRTEVHCVETADAIGPLDAAGVTAAQPRSSSSS